MQQFSAIQTGQRRHWKCDGGEMEEVCRPRQPESGKPLKNVRWRGRTSGKEISRCRGLSDSEEILLGDDENDNND